MLTSPNAQQLSTLVRISADAGTTELGTPNHVVPTTTDTRDGS
jgi:hypothetical protein